jgi:glycosyltransferase involved in cell wall biosynthesis
VDRQEGLKRAVLAVSKQEISFASIRIIVVDNSPGARQRPLASDLAVTLEAGVELQYVHEPKSGLAYARNRGIAASEGDYIVFLDDDQCPVDHFWLAHLVDAAIQVNADAAFGPVRAVAEPEATRLSDFVAVLHSRDLKKPAKADITGRISSLGTGNSCFRRSTCFVDGANLFSHEFNHTGGEDVDFLRRLRSNNRRFVWAPEAAVFEFLLASRLNRAYLCDRRFRQGQQRVYLQIASSPRRFDAVIFWMGVGSIQTIYHFLVREIARHAAPPEIMEKHDIQIWGGLGKIFWQRRFRRNFYGMSTGARASGQSGKQS